MPGFHEATPKTAVVYVDINGVTRGIDFLGSIQGVENDELSRMAVTVQLTGRDDLYIRIMHPLHCMISQVINAYDKKLNRRANRVTGDWVAERCEISVQTLNRNIHEYLDSGAVNAARKLVNKIAVFAMKPPALAAYIQDGINVLAAVPVEHSGWKENFIETFYMPLERKVSKKRSQYARLKSKG